MKTQVLEKDGKKEFVILTWEDYEKIKEMLEDYDDLKELRKAKAESKGIKAIPFRKAIKEIKKKSNNCPHTDAEKTPRR